MDYLGGNKILQNVFHTRLYFPKQKTASSKDFAVFCLSKPETFLRWLENAQKGKQSLNMICPDSTLSIDRLLAKEMLVRIQSLSYTEPYNSVLPGQIVGINRYRLLFVPQST